MLLPHLVDEIVKSNEYINDKLLADGAYDSMIFSGAYQRMGLRHVQK